MKIANIIKTACAVAVIGLCTLAYRADGVTEKSDSAAQKGNAKEEEEELPKVPASLKDKEFLLPVKVNTKAKVYFIYQSRSTCGICAAEAPAIVKIYKSMHGKGAELVMLNIDKDKDAAIQWAKKEKMKFPIVAFSSAGDVPFPYKGEGLLPCMVALDADGNKLGEANANKVSEFLKGWKKMVRDAAKNSKSGETPEKNSEKKHADSGE